jgi:hypothetical protein
MSKKAPLPISRLTPSTTCLHPRQQSECDFTRSGPPPADNHSRGVRGWAVPLGRLGFAARGVVFGLIGAFLILAAAHSSSAEVTGLAGALQVLRAQPYGWNLLAVTAAGLFAFGIFGLVQARYRHIDAPDAAEATAKFKHTVARVTGN